MVFTETPSNRQDINAARGNVMREQPQEKSVRPVNTKPPSQPQQQPVRNEMRGPQNTDIDNILSGLKTRNVNIHEQENLDDDDSLISISSLKEIQNTNMPKRSQRKQRSDRNTVSLDI
jgi:hypothetical protein